MRKLILIYTFIELILGLFLIYLYNKFHLYENHGSLTGDIFNYFKSLYLGIILFSALGGLILYLKCKKMSKYVYGLVIGFCGLVGLILLLAPLSNSNLIVNIGLIYTPIVIVIIGVIIPLWLDSKEKLKV